MVAVTSRSVVDAIKIQADSADWRPGAKRVIVVLGDSSFNNDTVTDAEAVAALMGGAGPGDDVELIGLRFSSYDFADGSSDDTTFTESIGDLGGSVFETGADPASIVAAILAGLTDSFEDYTEVSIDGGAGLPGVGVSSVCVGVCVGVFDRSVEREFEFDVTFTGLEEGVHGFDTFGLVDGSIVATEADTITVTGGVSVVPVPAAGWLMIAGLGGLAAMRRRKKS